jgi:transposase
MLPQADIVHDRFHINQHLNMAVDQVRRKENKILVEQGDRRLTGSKFLWLTNEENLKEKHADTFYRLKTSDLKFTRFWAIEELF